MLSSPAHFKSKLLQHRLKGLDVTSRSDERLRGGAWRMQPLRPPYPIVLPLSDISEGYCANLRNIFIRHILRIEPVITDKEYDTYVFNAIVTSAYESAKREIYSKGVMNGSELKKIIDPQYFSIIRMFRPHKSEEDLREWWNRARIVWNRTTTQIVLAIDKVLEKQPRIGADALVNASLPIIIISDRFEGKRLGLTEFFNSYIWIPEHTVINLRMNEKRRSHRLATVASAIVIENLYGYPIDTGCILYGRFDKTGNLKMEYDIFNIDDSSRLELIEFRNRALQIAYLRKDPGIPRFCSVDCPYYQVCHRTISG